MSDILSLQCSVLNMIARGRPLPDVLERICLLVERNSGHGLCSLMLREPDGRSLRVGSAPSLPAEAVEALNGLPVADLTGSCGTAAFTGALVVVADTANDPRWSDPALQSFANRFGVKACWSAPFFSREQEVLGTFAISHLQACGPETGDVGLLETAADLAGIALEASQTEAALRQALDELREANDRLRDELAERESLESQLLQAQKMEALGSLAGGIAHDLNNVLTVIGGYGELLMDLDRGDETLREAAAEIVKSGERGSALTQRLLAFARKQLLQPTVFPLDALLGELEPMLRPLIGDDVTLTLERGARDARVEADRVQVEQLIMNLCINARDAMPTGGRLSLRTEVLPAQGSFTRLHDGMRPGEYVTLTVVDSGAGMDGPTAARVFEPFFSTKEVGKGTGLGLSTAYGIARQSGGTLTVETAPGEGASFRLYLPRSLGSVAGQEDRASLAEPDGGGAVILLVEDDEAVRELLTGVLRNQGFEVHPARSSDEAGSVFDGLGGHVDLLLTDVVMPGGSGTVLAQQLQERRPGMQTILMSGYSSDITDRHGALPAHTTFLQKPVRPSSLLQIIRETLAGGARASAR
jgi:hypothetical protein